MARLKERFAEPRTVDYPAPPPCPAVSRSAVETTPTEKHVARLTALFKRRFAEEGLEYGSSARLALHVEVFLDDTGIDRVYEEVWFPSMVYKRMLWMTQARVGLDEGSFGAGTVVLDTPLLHRHLLYVFALAIETAGEAGEVRLSTFRLVYDLNSTATSSIADCTGICSYLPGRPFPRKHRGGSGAGPRPRRPRVPGVPDVVVEAGDVVGEGADVHGGCTNMQFSKANAFGQR
jgi:hypothetical protein